MSKVEAIQRRGFLRRFLFRQDSRPVVPTITAAEPVRRLTVAGREIEVMTDLAVPPSVKKFLGYTQKYEKGWKLVVVDPDRKSDDPARILGEAWIIDVSIIADTAVQTKKGWIKASLTDGQELPWISHEKLRVRDGYVETEYERSS